MWKKTLYSIARNGELPLFFLLVPSLFEIIGLSPHGDQQNILSLNVGGGCQETGAL